MKSQLQASQSKLTEVLKSKGELKEKLTEIQTKSQRLTKLLNKSGAQNNNLKQLFQREKQRVDQLEIKLKEVGKDILFLKSLPKFLYQLQKINHYKQLDQEQEAKIIQLPPDKVSK